ncbi:hypothetical protein [Streptomyces sp. NBC_00063]|uniref:hypothetical protein n=1 Tax=Streptomyces sp. NBC_00063 TaxID=2975638 RepID=UPI003D74D4E8
MRRAYGTKGNTPDGAVGLIVQHGNGPTAAWRAVPVRVQKWCASGDGLTTTCTRRRVRG